MQSCHLPQQPAEALPSEARSWAALMHLSGLATYLVPVPGAGVLGPLVLWLMRRDESEFEERQGRLAVNFQLVCSALYLGSLLLTPLLIGIPLLIVVAVLHVVATLVATVLSASGRSARYPLNVNVLGPNTLR